MHSGFCVLINAVTCFGRNCLHVPRRKVQRERCVGNEYEKEGIVRIYVHTHTHTHTHTRGDADKSLVRPTSRCRGTESIVSLERGASSCAEFQDFSCYRGWNEACQATRAISTTWWREISWISPTPQGKAPKEIHAILTETLGEHALLYATVKNWVAQFKCGDFSTCDAPRLGRPKTVTNPEINDQIHEQILEDRLI